MRPDKGLARPLRICLSPGSIGGGGIGVVMLNLAEVYLAQGFRVDLLLLDEVQSRPLPPGINAVRLGARARQALPQLGRYLSTERPDLVISARDYVNLMTWAGLRILAPRSRTRLVWTYHTHTSTQRELVPSRADRIAGRLTDWLVHQPDVRVAVSEGVARDLVHRLGLARRLIEVIDNPVWTHSRLAQREEPCSHPWLTTRKLGDHDPTAPILLGAGRLTAQKDFATLLDAFATLRRERPGARLVLLGEGEERPALAERIRRLGIEEAVDMPGQVPNVLPYLARADLFVLSSRWEGLPTILIEALGCGCPVVSTDCPSGPSEILEGGRLGPLVPPGDAAALARAMDEVLERPGDPGPRMAAARRFDADHAARRYLEVAGLHA